MLRQRSQTARTRMLMCSRARGTLSVYRMIDHIQLKFYLNGKELECPVTNVKGTVYPALYGM